MVVFDRLDKLYYAILNSERGVPKEYILEEDLTEKQISQLIHWAFKYHHLKLTNLPTQKAKTVVWQVDTFNP